MASLEIEVKKEGEDEDPKEWEICQWYDTLVKAEEIKADAKKMTLVAEHATKMKKAAIEVAKLKPKKITDLDSLRQAAKDKPMDDED